MHDRNGTPVQKGDVVLVEAVIGETYASEEYCNVQLQIGDRSQPNGPHNVHSSVTLNAQQVLLFKRS
jgi:hypothetical protein